MSVDALALKGILPATVSETGESVLVGFRLLDGSTHQYAIGHEDLAKLIHYWQFVAEEAREKRMRRDPAAKDKENPRPENDVVVRRIDFRSDAAGALALMEAITEEGIRVGAQVQQPALEMLYLQLPEVLNTMKERQEQKGRLQ